MSSSNEIDAPPVDNWPVSHRQLKIAPTIRRPLFLLSTRIARLRFLGLLVHRRSVLCNTRVLSSIYFANVAFFPQGSQSAEFGAK